MRKDRLKRLEGRMTPRQKPRVFAVTKDDEPGFVSVKGERMTEEEFKARFNDDDVIYVHLTYEKKEGAEW